MPIDLQHAFTSARTAEQSYALVLDLPRLVSCVEGGTVLAARADGEVQAQIELSMGVASLAYVGTVAVVEREPQSRRVVVEVDSSEKRGEGDASARVEFVLTDRGGTIVTQARLTGTAMTMGEAIPAAVLDEMIKDFAETFGALEVEAGV